MNAPAYSIDDIVYFKASAVRGFIEYDVIAGMKYNNHTDGWVYQLKETRNNLLFYEDEFVDECGAIELAIVYLQNNLNYYDDLLNILCSDGRLNLDLGDSTNIILI